jgi:hypothetical protein
VAEERTHWDLDPDYPGLAGIALETAGRPEAYVGCQAVILGCGGEDGLWMQLIGRPDVQHRRVGALVITDAGVVAYAEYGSLREKPQSTGGLLGALVAGKRDKLFDSWTWLARPDEIEHVAVDPAVDSIFGTYPAVTITTRHGPVTFGLDMVAAHMTSPGLHGVLTVLRHLGGASLQIPPRSERDPREDGVYVFGRAGINLHAPRCFAFRDGAMASTFSLRKALDFLDGTSDEEPKPVVELDGRYRVAGDELIVHDDGMYFRSSFWDKTDWNDWPSLPGPAPYGEMRFVDRVRLENGWGTLRAELVAPSWPPRIMPDGRLVARDLGRSSELPGLGMEQSTWGTDIRLRELAQAAHEANVELWRTGRGRRMVTSGATSTSSYLPSWLVAEDLKQASSGIVGHSYLEPDDEPPTERELTLVVETYDLETRRGLMCRTPMRRPEARHEGLMEPTGGPTWSEITIEPPSDPRYRGWDIDVFMRWVRHEIAHHARVALRKDLADFGGYAVITSDRQDRASATTSASQGRTHEVVQRDLRSHVTKHGTPLFAAHWSTTPQGDRTARVLDFDLRRALTFDFTVSRRGDLVSRALGEYIVSFGGGTETDFDPSMVGVSSALATSSGSVAARTRVDDEAAKDATNRSSRRCVNVACSARDRPTASTRCDECGEGTQVG